MERGERVHTACSVCNPGNGLDHSAQDSARWQRSRAGGRRWLSVRASVLLLGRQTDGQTAPLQNTPAAAP